MGRSSIVVFLYNEENLSHHCGELLLTFFTYSHWLEFFRIDTTHLNTFDKEQQNTKNKFSSLHLRCERDPKANHFVLVLVFSYCVIFVLYYYYTEYYQPFWFSNI